MTIELSKNLLEDLAQCYIKWPADLPIFHSPPNLMYLQQWADSHDTRMLQEIAHTIVNNINYVSFENFLNSLQSTILNFNQLINDKPYVLVIGESKEETLLQGCSDQWVAALALENNLVHPVKIITYDKLSEFLKNNPNINHALLLDDAAYSCSQKSNVLNNLIEELCCNKSKHLTLYIGIPFLTEVAKEKLLSFNSKKIDMFEVNVLNHQILPTINNILKNYVRYLQELKIDYIDDIHTLTYFDHKFPDYMSTLPNIYNGLPLHYQINTIKKMILFLGYTDSFIVAQTDHNLEVLAGNEYQVLINKFKQNCHDNTGYNIPTIISPYKNDKNKLITAIEQGTIGDRTKYPINDDAINTLISETKTQAKKSASLYKLSMLSLQDQSRIDKKVLDKINHRQDQKNSKKLYTCCKLM